MKICTDAHTEKITAFLPECADPHAPLFKKIAWALIHVMRVEERMNRELERDGQTACERVQLHVCVLGADSIDAQQFKLLSLIFAVYINVFEQRSNEKHAKMSTCVLCELRCCEEACSYF